MNKTVLLAALLLTPAAFMSAQEIKVNATGMVDSGTVNVQVTGTDMQAMPIKATYDVKASTGARTDGQVDIMLYGDASSTPTTTAEMVVDAEVQASKDKWIEILSTASGSAKVVWEPTDYSVHPDTMMAGDTVVVTSTQEVALFGFMKIEMKVTAEADMEGNITNIQKPWYAMFAW